ncbi:MAG: hypothetical protein ACRD0Y_01870 [Terriglobales bacterium]
MKWRMQAGLVAAAVTMATAAGCTHKAPAPVPPAVAAAAANNDPAIATMPAGPGKTETVRVCGGCHTLARVVRQHQTKAQWQATIAQMKQNGLFASPADLSEILSYLTQHYGPKQP